MVFTLRVVQNSQQLCPTTDSMVCKTLGAVLCGAVCVAMVLLLAHPARSQQVCKLELKIVSASEVRQGNGAPDTYVHAKVNGEGVCTAPKKQDSYNPVWNKQCPTLSNARLGKVSLTFEAWDADLVVLGIGK